MWLNLGSGSTPRKSGVVNVDIAPGEHVDVVHDLDVLPWPWDDRLITRIIAQDVFEHVKDPIGFMTESHRVLRHGGDLLIKSPYFQHMDAFTDPTHRRFCTPFTWDYWITGTVLHERHNPAYGGVAFGLIDRRIIEGSIFINLRKP